jgi:phage shock protein PspC (stress-responsive transcriptional regulator)
MLSGAFGIPPPIVTVIYVVLVVFIVLYLLQALGLYSGGPSLRLR